MAFKLSPELLVANYTRSATNGRELSIRSRRVLTLVFIPLWALVLYLSIQDFISAMEAKKEYAEAESYANNYKQKKSEIYSYHWDEEERKRYNLLESKISEYEWKMLDAKHKMEGYYHFILYFLYFVIAPWLILKIIFWIIDAGSPTK